MLPAAQIFQEKYGTITPQTQIINWMWYDVQTYSSGNTTLLTFFNVVRATKNLGNMELAGALNAGQAFITRAIRVHFRRVPVLGTAAPFASTDLALLADNGWLEFNVASKNYGRWPLNALPGGAGISQNAAAAGAEATDEFLVYATHGVPDPRAVYTLSQPLLIDPQINFNVTLNWAAAQTLTGDVDIQVMLDGELMRPVQ